MGETAGGRQANEEKWQDDNSRVREGKGQGQQGHEK
jgi:hypothetical protein